MQKNVLHLLVELLTQPSCCTLLTGRVRRGSIGNDGNTLQCKKLQNTIYNAKSCNVILCNAKLYFASSCGTSYSIQLLHTLLAGSEPGECIRNAQNTMQCNAMQAVAMSNYAMQKNVLHLLLELLSQSSCTLLAGSAGETLEMPKMQCNAQDGDTEFSIPSTVM